MAKYQKYAEYKYSGVAWLGDIPQEWNCLPIKHLCYVNDGNHGEEYPKESDYTSVEEGVPFIRGGNIHNFEVTNQDMLYITKEKNHAMRKGRLQVGDILFVNRGDIGKLALISEEHKGANLNSQIAYLRCEDNKISNKFLLYFLASTYITNHLGSLKMGSVLTQFPIGNILEIKVPMPMAFEQDAIANFLDHETAQIDTLITKQEKLIELLKEKRQAVISHAVTKGLNPNVKMKDSGVEWLGEVPEHWEIRRLKTIICSLESGCSVNAADIPAQSHELGVLKTSCVYTRSFRVEENKTVVPEDIQRVKCKVRKGSIIISRMNTPELVGASALVKVKADNIYLPDRLWQTIFFENIEIDAEYLSHFMTVQGFRDQIALGAEGASSSMQNIAKEDYLNINCLLPPLKEQILIREFIEQKLSILNHLNIKAQEAVDRLKERRTALISAAVTGKIDVRNWQNPDKKNEADMELSA